MHHATFTDSFPSNQWEDPAVVQQQLQCCSRQTAGTRVQDIAIPKARSVQSFSLHGIQPGYKWRSALNRNIGLNQSLLLLAQQTIGRYTSVAFSIYYTLEGLSLYTKPCSTQSDQVSCPISFSVCLYFPSLSGWIKG